MSRAPKHLLVVDDLPDNRGLLVQFLEDDYRLSEAATGLDALDHIALDCPDLVLLDLAMPVMDGYEVLDRLQTRQGSFLPVIVVTAAHEQEARLRALQAGAHEFLTKPIDPDELHARIRTLLALKAAHDELEARNGQLESLVAVRTRELACEKAFAERIINGTPAAIAFVDRALACRRANPAWASLTGPSAAQDVSASLVDWVGPLCRRQLEQTLRRVLMKARPFHDPAFSISLEYEGQMAGRFWDLTCEPVLGEWGDVEGVLVMAVDVTERVQRERHERERFEQSLKLERMKAEFLSVVSHELRTPLNYITGYTELLEAEIADGLSEEQRLYLANIFVGAKQMLQLVNNVLDVSKMAGGYFELDITETDFPTLVELALSGLSHTAAARGLRLDIDVLVADTLIVDADRIVQVLTHLLENAIKFTPDGGRVQLRASVRGDALITELSDSGQGIPADDIPKLFKPFDQLDMSLTRCTNGAGLGLHIVKHIVEAHGGQVGVVSEPGSGSTFWFSLPLAPRPAPNPPVALTEAVNQRRRSATPSPGVCDAKPRKRSR